MAEDNSKVQTLTDLIRYGQTSTYSVPRSILLSRFEEFVLLDKFIYEKYSNLMFGLSRVIELTNDELNEYKYKPDLLSYRLYGTPNLSHVLLYLNKCSEFEFNKKRVRYIPIDNIQTIFNLIMSHETGNSSKINKNAVR